MLQVLHYFIIKNVQKNNEDKRIYFSMFMAVGVLFVAFDIYMLSKSTSPNYNLCKGMSIFNRSNLFSDSTAWILRLVDNFRVWMDNIKQVQQVPGLDND